MAKPGMTVWGTPGGGIEDGESHLAALRRELLEEVGLTLETECHHIWHQEVVPTQYTVGFDGVINDFYLVRTSEFEPLVTLSGEQLAAEDVPELRWWPSTKSRPTSATPLSPPAFSPHC